MTLLPIRKIQVVARRVPLLLSLSLYPMDQTASHNECKFDIRMAKKTNVITKRVVNSTIHKMRKFALASADNSHQIAMELKQRKVRRLEVSL